MRGDNNVVYPLARYTVNLCNHLMRLVYASPKASLMDFMVRNGFNSFTPS